MEAYGPKSPGHSANSLRISTGTRPPNLKMAQILLFPSLRALEEIENNFDTFAYGIQDLKTAQLLLLIMHTVTFHNRR